MNKQVYVIIGRFVNDPEMKYTKDGKPYTKFRFATSRNWKNGEGERIEKSTFFNAVAWGKLAEIVGQYGAKGRLACIESDDIDASAYMGKVKDGSETGYVSKDGEPVEARCSLELNVRGLTFLDKNGNGAESKPAPAEDDDMPF